MAFALIEDQMGSVELMVFPDVYGKCAPFLKTDDPLLVTGILEVGEESCKIRATDVAPLGSLKETHSRRVNFVLDASRASREQLRALKDIIGRHPGECPACLQVIIPGTSRTTLRLPAGCAVRPSDDLSLEAEALFGYNVTTFE